MKFLLLQVGSRMGVTGGRASGGARWLSVALLGALPVLLLADRHFGGEVFMMDVRTQPVGNSLKGRLLEVQPTVALLRGNGALDVENTGMVSASLGQNPTGAMLRGFPPTTSSTAFFMLSLH